jgi:hypothetical protein
MSLDFITKIINTKGLFVSVGCGMGVLENRLRQAGKVVICIDPNNYDVVDRYTGDIRELNPDYKFVSELIADRPNVVGKVNLILNHPLPDYAMYDIMSIFQLEPLHIFLYYMKMGGAGSWLLHRFLRKNGVRTHAKIRMDEQLEKIGIDITACIIPYKYVQIYENSVGEHTYSILKRTTQITPRITPQIKQFVYKDVEEFVLIGSENTDRCLDRCIECLKSLV